MRAFVFVCLPLVICMDLVHQLNDTAHVLTRQIMLDQWYLQEKVRSEGCSGIKQVRHQRDGTRPYHTETHTGSGVASIHDHADSIRTMGMGEFHVVLNGVEFRTRHNDYLLQQPHSTSSTYHSVEDIPFPEVPPSVTGTVEQQIKEMKEFFRAFHLQDPTIRDYRPYFRPILSYLEGAWIYTGKQLEEPLNGERHWVDAKTWYELEEKARFTGYAGTKDAMENLALLPRTVVGINGTSPILAQWTYRIMAHPLREDLPISRLRLVDDLSTRMVNGMTMKQYSKSREARFTLTPTNEESWMNGRYTGTLLDELMEQIPGWDNYPGILHDESFGLPSYDYKTDKKTNSAYYHHLSKYNVRDGMGIPIRHRGYSDETLFMAMTSHEKVHGMDFNNCVNEWENHVDCDHFHQKWTYAFPMEIIYLTPLANWNPYDIDYHGWSSEPEAKRVTANDRDGSLKNPYDGTSSKLFYRTPVEFFEDVEYSVRPADTTGGAVWVLDSTGTARHVRASGHRTFIPNINGLGPIRQRYPIMPVHGEGETAWKELQALKDIVLDPVRYKQMLYSESDNGQNSMQLQLSQSLPQYGSHSHFIELTKYDVKLLSEGGVAVCTSTTQNTHKHTVHIVATRHKLRYGYELHYIKCDTSSTCWDGHDKAFMAGFTSNWEFVEDTNILPLKNEEDKGSSRSASATLHSFKLFVLSFILIYKICH